MTDRARVAIIGLGMAVRPHAKSLVDLARPGRGRLRVQPQRGAPPGVRRPVRLPAHRRSWPHPGRPSVQAVMILTPPNSHLELVLAFAGAGKHILLEKPLGRSTERALRLVEAAEAAGVTLGVVLQHRFRAGIGAPAGADRRRAASASSPAGHVVSPWWRPQSYYDQPGRGTLERDGGGVLITQGDPHPRSDAEPDRAGRRGRRDRRHDRAASHGDRGFRRRRPALCERRAGRADGHDRGLSGYAGADRADRHQGHRHPRRGRGHACTTRTAGTRASARSRAPAAAPIPWIFRTTPTVR